MKDRLLTCPDHPTECPRGPWPGNRTQKVTESSLYKVTERETSDRLEQVSPGYQFAPFANPTYFRADVIAEDGTAAQAIWTGKHWLWLEWGTPRGPKRLFTFAEVTADQNAPGAELVQAAIDTALQARRTFGHVAQDTMIVEELGELLTALARRERGRGTESQVDEEIADCLLVLLGATNPEVWRVLEAKTERLRLLIDAHP